MNLTIVENKLRKIHGLEDNWHVCKWEVLGDPGIGVEFTFWKCPLVTRGPTKGKPNWRKKTEERVLAVSNEGGENWTAEYETETGLCNECMGERKTIVGWNRETGTRTEACRRCNGTGKVSQEVTPCQP